MSGQPIKPIVSQRCYGLVDPNELQRKQQQQMLQEQQQMVKKYAALPTAASRHAAQQAQEHQPHHYNLALMSLMYPVSSGVDHRQIYGDTGPQPGSGYAQYCQSYYQQPTASVQELLKRREDLVRQQMAEPNNYLTQLALEDCDQQLNQWSALSQQTGGAFPGAADPQYQAFQVGVQPLKPNEKPPGMSRKQFNKMQPWVRKDSLRNGSTVLGGVGKNLLRRMGWREGFGLGKVASGPSEPVIPDNIRGATERRGLSTEGEGASSSSALTTTGKHPVSVLMELCAKNKFAPPEFTEVVADGPSHRPHFIMKVRVNEVDYQPTNASTTKKDAKAMAAIVCLRALGLLASAPASTNVAMEIMTKQVEKLPPTSTPNPTTTTIPPSSEQEGPS